MCWKGWLRPLEAPLRPEHPTSPQKSSGEIDSKTSLQEGRKKKVKASLDQAERDLYLFLKINPDLNQEDLERINVITLSILPATLSRNFNICQDCSKSVIFREDLNPDHED